MESEICYHSLERFSEVKDTLGQIFTELEDTLKRAKSLHLGNKPEFKGKCDELDDYLESVGIIKRIINRNSIKIAFFGKTGNGKSTAINALLHSKVLPATYGHTTSCLIEINGCKEDKAYVQTFNSTNKQEVKSLQDLANALYTDDIFSLNIVQVYWPISQCPLLKHDIVLIDSPGYDMLEEADRHTNDNCCDADVFVFVCDGTRAITLSERRFFTLVSNKVSKPNIFILLNRWDQAVNDDPDNIDRLRNQHYKTAEKFLTQEIEAMGKEEVKDHMFFVSALQALQNRINTKERVSSTATCDEYKHGPLEFNQFEEKLHSCVSTSVISTKFIKHIQKADDIMQHMATYIVDIHEKSKEEYLASMSILQSCTKDMNDFKQHIEDFKKQAEVVLSSLYECVKNELECKLSTTIEALKGNPQFLQSSNGNSESRKKEVDKIIYEVFIKPLLTAWSESLKSIYDKKRRDIQDHYGEICNISLDCGENSYLTHDLEDVTNKESLLRDFEPEYNILYYAMDKTLSIFNNKVIIGTTTVASLALPFAPIAIPVSVAKAAVTAAAIGGIPWAVKWFSPYYIKKFYDPLIKYLEEQCHILLNEHIHDWVRMIESLLKNVVQECENKLAENARPSQNRYDDAVRKEEEWYKLQEDTSSLSEKFTSLISEISKLNETLK